MPADNSKRELQRMYRAITDQSSMKFVVDHRCELAHKGWYNNGGVLSGGLLGKKRSMESLDDSENEEVAAFRERQRSMTPRSRSAIHLPRIHELDAVKRTPSHRSFYTPEPTPQPSPVPASRQRARSYPTKSGRVQKHATRRVLPENRRIPLWDLFAAIDLDAMMSSQTPAVQVQREASPLSQSGRMMTPPRTPDECLPGFLASKAGSMSPHLSAPPKPMTNTHSLPFVPHKAQFTYTDTRAIMNHFAYAKKLSPVAV
jgi:hypothetical protein